MYTWFYIIFEIAYMLLIVTFEWLYLYFHSRWRSCLILWINSVNLGNSVVANHVLDNQNWYINVSAVYKGIIVYLFDKDSLDSLDLTSRLLGIVDDTPHSGTVHNLERSLATLIKTITCFKSSHQQKLIYIPIYIYIYIYIRWQRYCGYKTHTWSKTCLQTSTFYLIDIFSN